MRTLITTLLFPLSLLAADPAAEGRAAAEELWRRSEFLVSLVRGLAANGKVSKVDAARFAEITDPAKKSLRVEFVYGEIGDNVEIEPDPLKITTTLARADLAELGQAFEDLGSYGSTLNRTVLEALCRAQKLPDLPNTVGYPAIAEEDYQNWIAREGAKVKMPEYFYKAP